MLAHPTTSRPARLLASLALTVLFVMPTAVVYLDAETARAETEEDLQAQKDHWQERYRKLLGTAAHYEDVARRSREDYAQAQRRNYPRGGARQRLIVQAEEADAQIETVRAEIEAFRLEARNEGAMPGWLYEVEDEPIVLPEPAAPDASGSDEEDDDRAGRNPLYFDDNDNDDDDS